VSKGSFPLQSVRAGYGAHLASYASCTGSVGIGWGMKLATHAIYYPDLQDKQCTYNVTLRCGHVTIFVVKKP